MKILIGLLLLSASVHAEPYVSLAWNETDHDNKGYSVDGENGSILTLGYRSNGDVFAFGEVSGGGTASGSGISMGLGIKLDGFELSGGIGRTKEEAIAIENGVHIDSADDEIEYEFIEASVSNVYLRVSQYYASYNFVTGSFADDREAWQLGYRLFF